MPKGKDTPRKIRQHYERLHHQRRIGGFDQERLDKATALPYEHWWVPTEGFGGFDAYSIFSFAHTGKVLLECPIYGNAIYVVEAGEERWLRMSKQELIESGAAKKIPHQGDWYRRVRQELEIG